MARYPFLREELPIFVGYVQLNQGLSKCRKTLTKLIYVGYGQLNSTTVLDFLHWLFKYAAFGSTA